MANISRNSFQPSQNYDKVIIQQGVPITDYDLNEMQDIIRYSRRKLVIEIFGNKIENVSAVIIRDKRGQEEDKVFPITIVDNKVTISFPLNNIKDLNVSHYGIYIRYDGYKLLNIVRESNECVFGNFIMMNNGKEFMFYTTQVGNLGLAIK